MFKWIKVEILYYFKIKHLEKFGLTKLDIEEYLETNAISKEDFVLGRDKIIKKVGEDE